MRALEVFAACAAHPRRRGNRIELLFAAVHEFVHGTKRKFSLKAQMSVVGENRHGWQSPPLPSLTPKRTLVCWVLPRLASRLGFREFPFAVFSWRKRLEC